ncbi:hypothetical protein M404DRAFT_110108, partial [Pisolithus tinctorius Marx 270]
TFAGEAVSNTFDDANIPALPNPSTMMLPHTNNQAIVHALPIHPPTCFLVTRVNAHSRMTPTAIIPNARSIHHHSTLRLS